MALKLINREEATENGEVFIIERYQSDKTGKETVVKYPKPSDAPIVQPDHEPSQLDRIEAAVAKTNKEIANAAIDEYTAMLMEEGVL